MENVKLPAAFIERLRSIVPASELSPVLASFGTGRATTFRVNTLKTGVPAALARLHDAGLQPEPVSWNPLAFRLPASDRAALMDTGAYRRGELYIQNLASMVPPLVLGPEPGEELLDLAAAPGSKTLQMAAMMENRGRLAAVEVVKSRFHKLKANIEAQGATIVVPYHTDGTRVWRKVENRFDRVLIDAPCSSESRFHLSDPKSFEFWSEKKVKEMSRKQKQLLYSALRALKPGGVCVYSTCSFSPEENELVVARQLQNFAGQILIEPVDLPFSNVQQGLTQWKGKKIPEELAGSVRILPDGTMDGFFVCRIRKLAP